MNTIVARMMLAAGLAWAGMAGATTLVYTGSYVTGVDDLVIDNKIYDVSFKAGSYNSVFGSSTPTFMGDQTGATHARDALTSFMAAQQSVPVLNSNTANSQPWGVALTPFALVDDTYRATQDGYDYRRPTWVNFGNLINEPLGVDHQYTNSYEFAVYSFDRNVSAPVPEPSSAAMLGLGLAGIALLRRKRQG